MDDTIPIYFLKTQSQPHDSYASTFISPEYSAHFAPVLRHNLNNDAMDRLEELLCELPVLSAYGGLVITSQRAVEAFEYVHKRVQDTASHKAKCQGSEKVVYVVGPATGNAVTSLIRDCFPRWTVQGQETGNGEALAQFILENYKERKEPGGRKRKPLLFIAGEQRRDTIPKTLMSMDLPEEDRIHVEELACYSTVENSGFEAHFKELVERERYRGWAVVFSPSGCEAMLRVLSSQLPEQPGQGTDKLRIRRDVKVASIGPTTRNFLKDRFGFEIDACAKKPSPEGVKEAIDEWNAKNPH